MQHPSGGLLVKLTNNSFGKRTCSSASALPGEGLPASWTTSSCSRWSQSQTIQCLPSSIQAVLQRYVSTLREQAWLACIISIHLFPQYTHKARSSSCQKDAHSCSAPGGSSPVDVLAQTQQQGGLAEGLQRRQIAQAPQQCSVACLVV